MSPVVSTKAGWQASPPGLPGPHTLAHLLHIPPLSAEARKTRTSNSGYRIYSVSWLSHSLSTIKRDFHERQECREKQRLQICTYVSRYKRRIISNNLCKKKKKVSGYILVEEKKKEKWRVGGTVKVLEAFLIQKFIEGQK